MSVKRITLIRHAKSSWDYEVDDKDRPLKERGVSDAHLVAAAVAGRLKLPDAVFSSPANRALHTCMIFMRTLQVPFEKLTITKHLYDFGGRSVMDFINSLDNSYDHVMIFGHNHAFTAVSNELGSEYIHNLPTAGLVHIIFEEDNWQSVSKGVSEIVEFPKNLKS
ncbi:SixA phosphatase family protein [Robertkochia aurantiaca]|uniref:SixA phosphatase family protein n=1 Tax=Robertkochia aurantiaca TaxID=2873700 RepID=UPI001CCB5FEA|nr:histidine phosphatase family protein [Robertkochia sp. 3YJGBD-33]